MHDYCNFLRSLVIWLALFAISGPSTHAQSVAESKEAGEKFKNVSVLSEMPADEMGKEMNMISASLGVNCNFCHEGTNFAKENVGMKDVARKMLTMTLGLNHEFFDGKVEVNCYSCHRGQSRPSTTLALPRPTQDARSFQPVSKPLPSDILAKHLIAVGGREKCETIKTLHVIAKRIEPSGANEKEELWQTASGLSQLTHQLAMGVVGRVTLSHS